MMLSFPTHILAAIVVAMIGTGAGVWFNLVTASGTPRWRHASNSAGPGCDALGGGPNVCVQYARQLPAVH